LNLLPNQAGAAQRAAPAWFGKTKDSTGYSMSTKVVDLLQNIPFNGPGNGWIKTLTSSI
jgi:hypothetical protein